MAYEPEPDWFGGAAVADNPTAHEPEPDWFSQESAQAAPPSPPASVEPPPSQAEVDQSYFQDRQRMSPEQAQQTAQYTAPNDPLAFGELPAEAIQAAQPVQAPPQPKPADDFFQKTLEEKRDYLIADYAKRLQSGEVTQEQHDAGVGRLTDVFSKQIKERDTAESQLPALIPQKQLDRWLADIDKMPEGPEKVKQYRLHAKTATDQAQAIHDTEVGAKRGLSYSQQLASQDPHQAYYDHFGGGSYPGDVVKGVLESLIGTGTTIHNVLDRVLTDSAGDERANQRNNILAWHNQVSRANRNSAVGDTIKGTAETLTSLGTFEGLGIPVIPAFSAQIADQTYSADLAAGHSSAKAALHAGGTAVLQGALMLLAGRVGKQLGLIPREELLTPQMAEATAKLFTKAGLAEATKNILFQAGEGGAIHIAQSAFDVATGVRPDALDPDKLYPEAAKAAAQWGLLGFVGTAGKALVAPREAYRKAIKELPDVLKQAADNNTVETVGPSQVPLTGEMTDVPGASFRATATAPTEYPAIADMPRAELEPIARKLGIEKTNGLSTETLRKRIAEQSQSQDQQTEPEPSESPAASNESQPTAPIETPLPALPEPRRESHVADEGDIEWMNPTSIKLDPARFQFKEGHKHTGEVSGNELTGKWDEPTPVAGIVTVWEDKNGDRYAINGHHRVPFAQRQGVKNIRVSVLKESEGITAEDARAHGAILNIKEGQGSVRDYADFAKQSGLTWQEAEGQGLLGRSKGRQGVAIGSLSEDNLYAGFRNRKIPAAKAAAIAEAAPNDARLQDVGIEISKRLSADELKNAIKLISAQTSAPRQSQGDLFGFDDSAIQESVATAKGATKIIKDLDNHRLAVEGALRRPEQAKKMGLAGDFDSIRAELERVNVERDKWSRWQTDPELYQQAREKAGLPVEARPQEVPAQQAPEQVAPSTFSKGDTVSFKRATPSGKVKAIGRVDRILPDGRYEVRAQNGGIHKLMPDEVSTPPHAGDKRLLGDITPVVAAPEPTAGERALEANSLARESASAPTKNSKAEPTRTNSRGERQPTLGGMPEDMSKAVGAGQQGLFAEKPETPGKVHAFGGGSTTAPLVAGTQSELTALVRTHTPGLEIMRGLRKTKDGILSLLHPSGQSPEHLSAAERLGAKIGEKNHRAEAASHQLRPFDKMFTRLGLDRADVDSERNPGIQFMAAMSTGREVTGRLRKAADKITHFFEGRMQKLAEIGVSLDRIREHYFPGMWTQESRLAFNAAIEEGIREGVIKEGGIARATRQQREWVKARVDQHLQAGTGSEADALQYLSRRPMHGKESFRKQKVFDDILTATEFGLRPISNNPIDLVKLKLAEMDKAILGHGYYADLKKIGHDKIINPYEQVPDGWEKPNDPYAVIYGPPTVDVSEYIDKSVYQGLLGVAEKLGISHERLAKLPRRGAIGLSYQGENKIQSQANTETSVIAHEIGHQLDDRYDLWANLLKRDKGKGFKPGRSELRAIADLTERGPKARSKAEKMAQVLEAYVHAPEKMQEVAPRVFGWFDKFVKSKPELTGLADLKPGLALQELTSEKYVGLPIIGYHIVPKADADILNNYLSASLYNNRYFGGLYKSWMGAANTLNQSQLGVGSGFHAGFTTADVQVSANASVLKDVYGVLRGNRSPGDLGKTAAKALVATVRTPFVGDKVLDAWRNPDGVIDPKLRQVIRGIELGGGGFKLEAGLQTNQADKAARAWYSGKRIRAAARSPIAALEISSKPIQDLLVPRQKAAISAELVSRIIEQNPGKSLEELTPQFRQAINRVDARLGQVRYDRLFIHNAAKNVFQALMRAPGWKGGWMAEIGGAFPDAAKFVGEWAKTGKAPQELPDRVAYTLSLLATTAAANGLATFVLTGTRPHGLDWFAFRDGHKDENGNETRFLLPTYMKDIIGLILSPGSTIPNSSNPLISMFNEVVVKNQDYYGTEIRHPGDPFYKQGAEVGKYVLKSFVPFWLRGAQKVSERGGGISEQAAPYIGIMPAPRHFTESAAERVAREAIQRRMPATRTQEEADKARQRSELRKDVRTGDTQSLDEAAKNGEVSLRSAKGIVRSAANPPLVNLIRILTASKSLDAWKAATADEREQIGPSIRDKISHSLKSGSSEDSQALENKIRQLGFEVPAVQSTRRPPKLDSLKFKKSSS